MGFIGMWLSEIGYVVAADQSKHRIIHNLDQRSSVGLCPVTTTDEPILAIDCGECTTGNRSRKGTGKVRRARRVTYLS